MGKLEMIIATLEFIKATVSSMEYDDQILYYGRRIEELEELLVVCVSTNKSSARPKDLVSCCV